jgi:hypothetical protein
LDEVPQPRIVIRTRPPVRLWLLGGLALAVTLGVAYLLFEYGRYSAGYSTLAARERERELRSQIRERDATIRDLQRAAADLETFRKGQAIERSELARTIGDLQAEVARQSQELAFYKGIVVQSAAAPEVKVQEFRIAPGPADGRYVVRITLVQPGRPDSVVSGTLTLVLEGTRGEAPARLDLGALTAGRQKDLRYSFRYFENLAPEIEVPAGFVPERMNVEVRSSRRGIAPVSQTFLWSIEKI